MKTTPLYYVVPTALLLTFPAFGQDGFQLPDINPFKSAAEDGASAELAKDEPGFRLPPLPKAPALPKPAFPSIPVPKFELPKLSTGSPSPARREPSAWSRLNRSSKAFFSKTKSVLLPWADDDPKRVTRNGMRVARRSEKRSFIENLFSSEPAEEIDSVNKYLALPRPTPYD